MTFLRVVVPGIPPSVNHYKMRTRKGVTFVSDEAKRYKLDLALCAGGRQLRGDYYRVKLSVFLGPKQRGDVDNFAKCALDGLVEAGVIHSDDAITSLTIEKARDHANPRTEITVEALP